MKENSTYLNNQGDGVTKLQIRLHYKFEFSLNCFCRIENHFTYLKYTHKQIMEHSKTKKLWNKLWNTQKPKN